MDLVLTHFIVAGDVERSRRDPDGHLIEVGQATQVEGWRPPSGEA